VTYFLQFFCAKESIVKNNSLKPNYAINSQLYCIILKYTDEGRSNWNGLFVDSVVTYIHISLSFFIQGNDEEAVVDQGKTSSTIHTNFEKEELESKSLPPSFP